MIRYFPYSERRNPALTCLICLAFLLAIAACATQPPGVVLNSDLIEEQFGNYAVDILHSSEKQRITSLISQRGAEKTTRTFAVVEFTSPVPAALVAEHEKITAGGSIGAVFRSAGWTIEKHNIYVGELTVNAEHSTIGRLMQLDLPQQLASHIYLFVVRKNQQQLTYATIFEFHHPEHLSSRDLGEIYGEMLFDDSERTSLDDFVELPPGY